MNLFELIRIIDLFIPRSLLLLCVAWASAATTFGAPRITEFMAANDSLLADEDGEFSDWLEIHNPDSAPISLEGFHLTDKASNLAKWTFPAVTLDPGAYLTVFASGKNRVDPAGRLHTNFQLSSEGEYLALVQPDGATVVNAFAPSYPPQFEDDSFGLGTSSDGAGVMGEWRFFSTPTPGAPNTGGTRAGPVIGTVGNRIPQPAPGPFTVTATVRPVNGPVSAVTLFYRSMFGPETTLAMVDNGANGDVVAGDGIWTATIPGEAFASGEMTRWRFVAADVSGTETKEPAYRDIRNSPQYFGTVALDPSIETRLPVFHWFTASPSSAGTTSGSRGAVYYDGEFYDNVLFNLHGQSSSNFPKKSYNLDFNRSQRFRWSTNAPRVADIDLLTNWADKSKVRHVLAYEVMRESGVAAHFAYTVRVQQNGNFFSTADLVEDADEIYLARAGLNKNGALYKVYSNQLNRDSGDSANSGVEKKTRRFENNRDLQELINGLDLTGTALANYMFDNIDIPRCVNMLAANSVIRNIDMHRKNWYIYRDTGRTDEWAILPWDLDLSHGRVWNQQNTYFDNALYTDGFVLTGTSIRLVSHLVANPAIRSMILRRIRTLTDRFLQPPPKPGMPESQLYYERRLNELSALIDPPDVVPSDARRDFEKWGSWLHGGSKVSYTSANAAVETMTEAIQRWKTEYLPGRRNYIYNTQIVGKGGQIPEPQTGRPSFTYTPLVRQGAPAKAFVPTDGQLSVTWIGIPSFEPFNASGWINGVTGVGFDRGGGGYQSMIGLDVDTQMRTNTAVYLRIEFEVTDPTAFDRLELRMKYDDGFVAFLNGAVIASANSPVSPKWNSTATAEHQADATKFDIYDVTDKKSNLRTGRNILAIQGLNHSVASSDMIIVPELYGGAVGAAVERQPRIDFGMIEASPASGNQDQEYIRLLNPNQIAVDISDWRLAGGVEHTFAPGTVISPNGTLYVCPDAAAFRARTVSPKRGEGLFIQGGYNGHLSSFGETLVLIDSAGATNNTATYEGRPSDAQQYLVLSELMYHPSGDGLAEFIELLNISDSVTLDLNNVRFTQGVEFNFTGGAITSLAPGARVLVVRDLAAFGRVYGTGRPVAGVFANGGALSNGGERIKLEDADNETICEFTYDDALPWEAEADGSGYSLVLSAPESHPDHALATNWRSSSRAGGSPGGPDAATFPANPAADANGNGEPDLLDYAMGNDLGLPPIFPTFTLEPGALGAPGILRLSYSINPQAEGIEIDVLFSTDLATWQEGDQHLEGISTEPLGDGRALSIWRIKSPLSGEPQLFMRFRVSVK